jgi:hypothetical protein
VAWPAAADAILGTVRTLTPPRSIPGPRDRPDEVSPLCPSNLGTPLRRR